MTGSRRLRSRDLRVVRLGGAFSRVIAGGLVIGAGIAAGLNAAFPAIAALGTLTWVVFRARPISTTYVELAGKQVRLLVGGAIDSETANEEVVAVGVARAVPRDATSALSPGGAPVPIVVLELEDGRVVELSGLGFSRHHDIFSAQSQPWIVAQQLASALGVACRVRRSGFPEEA